MARVKALTPKALRRAQDRALVSSALSIAAYILDERIKQDPQRPNDIVFVHEIDQFQLSNLVGRIAVLPEHEAQEALSMALSRGRIVA